MSNYKKTYIIAEAGVNHDGDIKKAYSLVDIAARSGADAAKFQLFIPDLLVTHRAPTATYQANNLGDTQISQLSMLERLALNQEQMLDLAHYCTSKNIDFLCTPFEHTSLKFLSTQTSMRYIKLASGEVTNGPLLLAAARTGLPVILSTGMSTIEEIGTALAVLYYGYTHHEGYPSSLSSFSKSMLPVLNDKVTLLQCVSQYPAPIENTNLLAIQTLRDVFGLPIGFSDHSPGISMATAAAALGACVIEKHFTYDCNAIGPDHAASLTEEELKAMVTAIREVERGRGDGQKTCQAVERNTLSIARRSVVAARPIAAGEIFSETNLICKRPATGEMPPNQLWNLLGKPAKSDYAADDFIRSNELEQCYPCQEKMISDIR
jgi:N-acetylneuraminate synthase